jgi:hypothetical protein
MNYADRTKVVEAIAHHDSLRSSYFWSGDNGDAQARSRWEGYLSRDVEVEVAGHAYRYEASVQISRTKVYYRGRFSKNGVIGTVRLFKGLLR